jgi:hypothetical protein
MYLCDIEDEWQSHRVANRQYDRTLIADEREVESVHFVTYSPFDCQRVYLHAYQCNSEIRYNYVAGNCVATHLQSFFSVRSWYLSWAEDPFKDVEDESCWTDKSPMIHPFRLPLESAWYWGLRWSPGIFKVEEKSLSHRCTSYTTMGQWFFFDMMKLWRFQDFILVFEMDSKRILVFSVVDYLLLKYNFQQLS